MKEDVIAQIEQMFEEELARANEKHGGLHSCHEGYAVLAEEFEELNEELKKSSESISNIWQAIKRDDIDEVSRWSAAGLSNTVRAIGEGIQTAAMLKKLLNFSCEKKKGA